VPALSRRSFLGAMLAASAGPAIVRAASLMPIQPVLETFTLSAQLVSPLPGMSVLEALRHQMDEALARVGAMVQEPVINVQSVYNANKRVVELMVRMEPYFLPPTTGMTVEPGVLNKLEQDAVDYIEREALRTFERACGAGRGFESRPLEKPAVAQLGSAAQWGGAGSTPATERSREAGLPAVAQLVVRPDPLS